jgi:hypothetical protein
MSVFNLLETFFFISLGITFVLISLLVYHFRQRIMVLEQKNDTMFEIINNVVTEISNLRNITMNPFQQEPPYQEYAEKIKIIEDEHFRQVHREEDEDEGEMQSTALLRNFRIRSWVTSAVWTWVIHSPARLIALAS